MPLWRRRPKLLTCSCCARSSRSVFAHLFLSCSLSLTDHLAIQHTTIFSEAHPSLYNTYIYSTLFRSHVPYYSENRKTFMFTPPPSPLPSTLTSFHVSAPPVPSYSPSPPSTPQQFLTPGLALSLPPPKHGPHGGRLETRTTIQDRKRRIAWCTGLMVIIVPLILVLITFLKRFASHPLFLDLLAGPPPGFRVLLATRTDEAGHLVRALHRRQTGAVTMSSAASSASGTVVFPSVATPTSTPVPSQTVPTIPSSPPVLPTPFPQPFDTTLGNNFTTNSCDTFFTNMTQSLPFRQCRPFSFLSQTSSAFLKVSGILTPSAIHLHADFDAVLLQFAFRHSQISRNSTLIFGAPVTLPWTRISARPTWDGSQQICWMHVPKKRAITIR